MRISYLALAAAAAFSLTACESPADNAAEQQADAIEANAEQQADAIENQADAAETAGNEAKADALEEKADAVEEAGNEKAVAVEQSAGTKD